MSSGFSNLFLRRFSGCHGAAGLSGAVAGGLGPLERRQQGCPGDGVLMGTLCTGASWRGCQPEYPATFPEAPPSLSDFSTTDAPVNTQRLFPNFSPETLGCTKNI